MRLFSFSHIARPHNAYTNDTLDQKLLYK